MYVISIAAGSNNDVFDALDFAAQYPFRSGASKVIVVIPCSDCSESKLSKEAIAARMNSEDIAVHVINDFSYEITVGGKNPASTLLFGRFQFFLTYLCPDLFVVVLVYRMIVFCLHFLIDM